MNEEYIAIVEDTFDPEETQSPFGKRWGGNIFELNAEHLAALQAGKAIALDVMNEYVTFVVLENSNTACRNQPDQEPDHQDPL